VTLAERLGYPPGSKLLIVHADDVGMCHAVNDATIDAMGKGIVTSGSVMVPCPWFPEIAGRARQNPDLDLGIHITLTSEWRYYRWRPVSPIDKVPGLIDEEGFMWRSVEDVVRHATPEEVEMEIRAQVERALEFGMNPTHIDTHMGTIYASPEFFEAYCRVAREFGLPAMIVSPQSQLARSMAGENPALAPIFERMRRAAEGMPILDELVTGFRSAELGPRREEFKSLIESLRPGVTQVIVHLGLNRPELRAIAGSWRKRYHDYLITSDPEMREFVEEQGVVLIGWREIKERFFGRGG